MCSHAVELTCGHLTRGEHHQLVIPSLGESSFKSHSQSEMFSGNGMFAARV